MSMGRSNDKMLIDWTLPQRSKPPRALESLLAGGRLH